MKKNTWSKWKKSTWLGRKGKIRAFHLDSKLTGLRVSVLHWYEDDQTEIKLIEGDGCTSEFREYSKVILEAATEEQVNKEVKALIELRRG
ncbi:hypothetical protein [Halobacillus sp. H74]|uniref:hypothetical protein n=1 Tax=Halobacillus sp. H74 TaxID=3457436 RepID=UPI003FCE4403